MGEIDRVQAVLDDELRSAAYIAARCGLVTSAVEAGLRELRRRGLAEFAEVRTGTFRWRLAPSTPTNDLQAEAGDPSAVMTEPHAGVFRP
jgi:hypothetical protein